MTKKQEMDWSAVSIQVGSHISHGFQATKGNLSVDQTCVKQSLVHVVCHQEQNP